MTKKRELVNVVKKLLNIGADKDVEFLFLFSEDDLIMLVTYISIKLDKKQLH